MAKRPRKDRGGAAPAKPEFAEIAPSQDRDLFGGWLGELIGTPDPVLESLGGDMAHYRRLMSDTKVKACWQQRQRALLSADWEVEAGGDTPQDKAAAEDLDRQLKAISFDAVCAKMLHAQFYGFAAGELMYALDDGRVVLTDIRVRRQERFAWTRDLETRLLRPGAPLGVPLPLAKFWIVKAEGDNDDDPHGLGLAHWLYWPNWFKRNGAKFWAVALEKYGMPTAMGAYPAGASPKERADLLAMLQAIHGSSAVAFPEGFEAKLLESMKTSGGSHEAWMRYWDEEIIQVILSQTMTTNNGSSRSQAEVHEDVRDDVVKGDADLLCESFNNGPAKWLAAWNHPGAAPPRVWRRLEAEEDLTARATREKTISEMTGLRPTAKHVQEVYGGEWEIAPALPGPPAPPSGIDYQQRLAAMKARRTGADADSPAFAEPSERDATDDLVDQLAGLAGPVVDGMVDQVRIILATSADWNEVRRRLDALAAALPEADLAAALEGAMTVSALAGAAADSNGG